MNFKASKSRGAKGRRQLQEDEVTTESLRSGVTQTAVGMEKDGSMRVVRHNLSHLV